MSSIQLHIGGSWQDAQYGDTVEVQGKLSTPQPHSSPEVLGSISFPRITIVSPNGNPIIRAITHLRIMLATIILQSLPQPEATLLIAILVSLRTSALKQLISNFNVTGTAHLIAPSGFKVTLLAGLVKGSTGWLYEGKEKKNRKEGKDGWLLPAQKRKANLRRWGSTVFVLASIFVYTVLSGIGPAAIRAGIMGSLLVLAPRIGRVYNCYTALAMAALIMSLLDPFVLWDVGFQLSFLGTLGIFLLMPYFQRLLHPLTRIPGGHALADIMAVTLAAQIATLPIIAITFNQISFIAPIANILTVPLLSILLFLGVLLCIAGLIAAPLGVLVGWILLPLLWYLNAIVPGCRALPGAYTSVQNVSPVIVWGYYGLLAIVCSLLFYKWPQRETSIPQKSSLSASLSRRRLRLFQLGAALLIVMATGTTALAAQHDGKLTITFFSLGPGGQASQGEAIFITTPDGKTMLIDGGLDAPSLAQALDSRLPFWQRSLDMVILTTPLSDHLIGLQDVVQRYQIGEVLDAGMLHPNTGYALWRRTISNRNIHYEQVRQGASITIGSQVELQMFWPASPLHKGTDEERSNALIIRLIAPGIRLLLLGEAASNTYALRGLLDTIQPDYLQADVVQMVVQANKKVPPELQTILHEASPSLLVLTPATLTAKQRKAGQQSPIVDISSLVSSATNWQIVQTAEEGTLELQSSDSGWGVSPV